MSPWSSTVKPSPSSTVKRPAVRSAAGPINVPRCDAPISMGAPSMAILFDESGLLESFTAANPPARPVRLAQAFSKLNPGHESSSKCFLNNFPKRRKIQNVSGFQLKGKKRYCIFGAKRSDEQTQDRNQTPGPERRKNRVPRRRDRLHGPQSFRHRRGPRCPEPGRHPGRVQPGGRRHSPALPRGLAQGKADRDHLRKAGRERAVRARQASSPRGLKIIVKFKGQANQLVLRSR